MAMRALVWGFLGLAACVRPIEATESAHEDADTEASLLPEPSFHRDAALESHSLGQLLMRSLSDMALDSQLYTAFSACREFGIPHEHVQDSDVAAEVGGSTTKEEIQYCNRVRYVRHVRLKYQTMQTHVAHVSSTDTVATPDSISSRELKDLDLQSFFEQYADRQQPVVLQSPPELPHLGLPWESMQQIITACFRSATNGDAAPLKLEDPACDELLSQQFRVPLFMAHDYLQRTSGSLPDTLLPSLVRLRRQQQQILSCPYGLHLMALPLTNSAEIALFRRQFEPLASRTATSGSPQEIALHVDGGIDPNSASDTVFSSALLDQMPMMHRGDVSTQDLLFVPGSLAASARASEASSSQEEALLLRFCYTDASNFNAVKEEIRVEALVSDDALQLLLALRSPTFDTSIPRRPAPGDALWTAFRTWPKETKLVKRSDLLNSETGSDQLQLSRRERLKLWQDDKRWDRHIESLTLPVSMAPVVMNTTRTTATLRWQDVYQPPKNDITGYGYQVEWRLESSRQNAEEPFDSALNVTHKQLVRSAMPTQLFGDDFDGKDIQAVVRGLQADSAYSFTVRVYVGDAMGLTSDRSRSVHTDPPSVPSEIRGVPVVQAHDATCVMLQWMDPVDDGARAISFYVVAVRDLSSGDDRDVLASLTTGSQVTQGEREFAIEASATTTRGLPSGWRGTASPMCNLFPSNSYQFRMAATNAMGIGAWSARTDPMTMPTPTALPAKATVPTIRGIGDPAYVRFWGQDPASLTEIGPSALLSDVKQQLVVRDRNETTLAFDVWAGHYSPRLFQVSSEIVRADPLDASEPLRNADAVRNRLVLVTRGQVPIMFKVRYAQQAGALGVVIADVDADSSCASAFDQSCVPGADRARGEGFAMLERHRFWLQNRIPCVLLAQPQAQQLLSLTD